MKLPLEWIQSLIDIDDISTSELVDKLTFSGLEVEGVETIGSDFEGVVVGEVLSWGPHPDADRLRVCKVSNGDEELDIVCGASNFDTGDKVALATVGTVLPNGMKMKKAKIRGQVSMGMMCALDELGLGEDHSGIIILDADTQVGIPFAEVQGPPQEVLVIEVTPNRPDCLSALGVARELSALLGRPVKRPEAVVEEGMDLIEDSVRIQVREPELCPRYTGRVIKGVKVAPSPDWMQQRLTNSGIRPINNLVDITNYVLLECGQPLHAFDLNLLHGHQIVVRHPGDDEDITTLDEEKRELDSDMLMICDNEKPVAVAGVMGGAGSEIHEGTTDVLLESAFFEPTSVRRTARKLGMSTDSSYRFERGVDPELAEWASRRAAGLIAELGGGTVSKGVIDVCSELPARPAITCRFAKVRDLIGVDIANDAITSIFEGLELGVTDVTSESCVVNVPSWRFDLEREVDLIEEIARIHGLDQIPAPAPRGVIVPDADNPEDTARRELRERLAGFGLNEAMHYSFVATQQMDRFDSGDTDQRIVLPNPISTDHAVLRTSLVPQLCEALGRNRARQIQAASLFELGRVFIKDEDGSYLEQTRLAIGLMGEAGNESGGGLEPEAMFLQLKGLFEQLTDAVSCTPPRYTDGERPWLESGSALEITIRGRTAGVMGILKASIADEWRIADAVGVLEIDADALLSGFYSKKSYSTVPIYPSVSRDVAMLVDESIRHENVIKVMRNKAPAELTGIRLFDIYRSKSIGSQRKSMAYTLVYQSPDRTLTDEEVNQMHDKVKARLVKELSADVREG